MTTVEETVQKARTVGRRALSEFESKRILAAYGVAVTRETLVADAKEAVAAADDLGYPVVVKACSHTLAHKSDAGFVCLGLTNPADVEAAVTSLAAKAAGIELEGYLVQEMVSGRREIIVGGLRDKLFGPSVMVGLGGIMVEAVGDVAFRLAPLDHRDALEMMGELQGRRIFGAFRGEPAADLDALGEVLQGVGRLLLDTPEISQVDVNPLILRNGVPVAVDALITLEAQS